MYFSRTLVTGANPGRKVLNEEELLAALRDWISVCSRDYKHFLRKSHLACVQKRGQGEELVIFDPKKQRGLQGNLEFFSDVSALIGKLACLIKRP